MYTRKEMERITDMFKAREGEKLSGTDITDLFRFGTSKVILRIGNPATGSVVEVGKDCAYALENLVKNPNGRSLGGVITPTDHGYQMDEKAGNLMSLFKLGAVSWNDHLEDPAWSRGENFDNIYVVGTKRFGLYFKI